MLSTVEREQVWTTAMRQLAQSLTGHGFALQQSDSRHAAAIRQAAERIVRTLRPLDDESWPASERFVQGVIEGAALNLAQRLRFPAVRQSPLGDL